MSKSIRARAPAAPSGFHFRAAAFAVCALGISLSSAMTAEASDQRGATSGAQRGETSGARWTVELAPVPGKNPGAPRGDRSAIADSLRFALDASEAELERCLARTFRSSASSFKVTDRHWIDRSVVVTANSTLYANSIASPRSPMSPARLGVALDRLRSCPIVRIVRAVPSDPIRYPRGAGGTSGLPFDPSVPHDFAFDSGAALVSLPANLRSIGLDRLAITDPDLRGRGVLIGEMDTGVDGAHPVLAGKVARFYDGLKRRESVPFDAGGHGTHVAGLLVGEDPDTGARFGVAPEARLVASAAAEDNSTMLAAMEWMLTVPDLHVVNNSWSIRSAADAPPFYRAIEAWDAAGILTVFSAGNAGPRPETIPSPHEHPLALAIGATTTPDGPGEIETLLSLSSRGPARYLGRAIAKPELLAAGDEINSSFPYRRYGVLSGTSMAAPMVTGAAAILLQVDPTLSPAALRETLLASARAVPDGLILDLGAAVAAVRARRGFDSRGWDAIRNAVTKVLPAAARNEPTKGWYRLD